jgi:drug/metabolite transporter (DMT)-like permease
MLCGSFSFTLMAELAHDLSLDNDWRVVVVFRAALVAAFAALTARARGAKLVFWPWRLWVRSVAGSCSMLCTFYAFAKLPAAAIVVTLTNTFPIWVALFSWLLYRHFPGWKTIAAILVGVAGVVLVEQPHLESSSWGIASALAAAAFTGIAMLGLHSLSGINTQAIVVHFSSVATLFCLATLVLGPDVDVTMRITEPRTIAKLVAMGLTALVGQLFLTMAFAAGAPAKVSVVGLTQIVFTLAFDTWFFGHPLNVVSLVGTALVIAPTAMLLFKRDI